MKKIISRLLLSSLFLMPTMNLFSMLDAQGQSAPTEDASLQVDQSVPAVVEQRNPASLLNLCREWGNSLVSWVKPEKAHDDNQVRSSFEAQTTEFAPHEKDSLEKKSLSVVKKHPYAAVIASTVGLVWGIRLAHDFFWLKNLELLLTDEVPDYQVPQRKNAETFRFYTWRLSATEFNDKLCWKTAADVNGMTDAVAETLRNDLDYTSNSQRIFIKEKKNESADSESDSAQDSDDETSINLFDVSETMQDELVELRAYMDSLTQLEIKSFAEIGIHLIDRIPFSGLLSKKVIIDHLRLCEKKQGAHQFNNLFNDLGSFSGDEFQAFMTRWNDYLNGYGKFISLKRPFSWREKTKMRLYVLTAARYARLQAIKDIVDGVAAKVSKSVADEDPDIHPELQRWESCIMTIRENLKNRKLPKTDYLKNLHNKIKGLLKKIQEGKPFRLEGIVLVLQSMNEHLQQARDILVKREIDDATRGTLIERPLQAVVTHYNRLTSVDLH